MTAIAFLGLGAMGRPMAERLIAAGESLTVWNRTPGRADGLAGRARITESPGEAVAEADAVVTMLATPDAVRGVLLEHGTATAMRPGTALIEMSTIGPDALAALAAELPDGVELVDAPVLGSVANATEGTLKVLVGATDRQFERWRHTLAAFGEPSHVGAQGAGAAMKLVANSTLAGLMTLIGEALQVADSLGLDEETTLGTLLDSPIGAALSRKLDRIRPGRYPPSFKLELMRKDMRLLLDAAADSEARLRVAAAVESWLGDADADGLGGLDYSAVVAAIRGTQAST